MAEKGKTQQGNAAVRLLSNLLLIAFGTTSLTAFMWLLWME